MTWWQRLREGWSDVGQRFSSHKQWHTCEEAHPGDGLAQLSRNAAVYR